MKTRARLCVDLGPVKSHWEARCAREGVSPAEAIRQLVHGVLAEHELSDDLPGPAVRRLPVDGPRERIEIRLTQAERDAARQHALAGGLAVNRWIVAVIRARLVHEPQLGEREMRLLADSNQHLATIVTILGRLQARADVSDAEHVLQGARAVIDAHLRAVTQVLRANLDRWSR